MNVQANERMNEEEKKNVRVHKAMRTIKAVSIGKAYYCACGKRISYDMAAWFGACSPCVAEREGWID